MLQNPPPRSTRDDPLERLRSALAGRYDVEWEVGRGGMSRVYAARDLRHGRRVAIKVLRPEFASILGADRFLREIEIAARLQHPHILPLFDSGEAGAGDHTIILSTHILPEVEQTCERVVIISKGKLVATDTVDNLTNRMRGSENVSVEVEAREGTLDVKAVQQRLEQVAGVSKVILRDDKNNRASFEVESLQGRSIRADLAKSIVEGGFALTELKAAGMSLEDVFLQLTSSDKSEKGTAE